MKPKVIVALSGGVDSAVAAYLLKKQGYQVEAVYLKNWIVDHDIFNCPWEDELADAESIAKILNIPLRSIHIEEDYRRQVIDQILVGYRSGLTPNPDVLCNQSIKFGVLLEKALELGASFVATGHYAQVKKQRSGYSLWQGRDWVKDQSYFLYRLNQRQLSQALFPIGKLEKSKVRQIAKQVGLPVWNKKDSQGVCFLGDFNFTKFLEKHIPKTPGKMVTVEGTVLGEHQGLSFYTIGQRKGLKLAGGPYFVEGKDFEKNHLILGKGGLNTSLYLSEANLTDLHWITKPPGWSLSSLRASIRYNHPPARCKLVGSKVIFKKKQRAITPGQSIVFYQQKKCLGGGFVVG